MFLKKKGIAFGTACVLALSSIQGCASTNSDDKIQIEIVSYKPEATKVMAAIQDKFNAEHDDIELTINSPNEAMTILKTRFVRENYPDIIAIGGDINYSNFLDSDLFADISDLECISEVKEGYMEILENLEFLPTEGVYALPFVANAAGILYNKDMFDEHGWEIPTTWTEFIDLCEEIQSEGITPLYFGYKDTWTTLAPWNSLAVSLVDSDVCSQVSAGETTFEEAYSEVADKQKQMLDYSEPNPFAYSYNDAATAFANGQAAMWPIGSYAVPQIQSVNPDINIDSFVTPASDDASENVLNSGIDLMFCVMEACENKEAAYEVLEYLYSDEIINMWLDDQGGVATKEGDFELPVVLTGMKDYIESGVVADYQDHHYPSEMSVDALIQTYLLDDGEDAKTTFLQGFDSDWQRYNRDLIARVQEYNEEHAND
jgi:raffinose/stachyose/melibiose transport system substrate-binding protein